LPVYCVLNEKTHKNIEVLSQFSPNIHAQSLSRAHTHQQHWALVSIKISCFYNFSFFFFEKPHVDDDDDVLARLFACLLTCLLANAVCICLLLSLVRSLPLSLSRLILNDVDGLAFYIHNHIKINLEEDEGKEFSLTCSFARISECMK
jgi:hypothetical protein